jgi:DNA methylase
MTTDPGDLVLDPTCGSGTTAYVAEQWGRRWITIDTSRVALALARTRLMAARFPYYLLADSAEGRKRQAELTGTPTDPNAPPPQRDLHKGFVYRTVPHVTLKSIANNPDIKEGMTHTGCRNRAVPNRMIAPGGSGSPSRSRRACSCFPAARATPWPGSPEPCGSVSVRGEVQKAAPRPRSAKASTAHAPSETLPRAPAPRAWVIREAARVAPVAALDVAIQSAACTVM